MATWKPHDSQSSSPVNRDNLPDSAYAFPKERKEPMTDASHVRNAIARFDQVKDVSDEEREAAFSNIQAAAEHFGVEMTETSWRELGGKPHTPNAAASGGGTAKKASARKSPARKSAAKKASAKKSAAKKTSAKKSAAKKAAGKKTAAKKAARKTAAKGSARTASRKASTARKTSASRKSAAKKTKDRRR